MHDWAYIKALYGMKLACEQALWSGKERAFRPLRSLFTGSDETSTVGQVVFPLIWILFTL